MSNEKSLLETKQMEAREKIAETNKIIEKLGESDKKLSDCLNDIQTQFELIRNRPIDRDDKYAEVKKIHSEWIGKVENIQTDYEKTMNTNVKVGASGVGVGIGLAALGPSAAMGIATTFGVASTGTAISSLSGAVATRAALAWLGGGALCAGGGGIAVGRLLLSLAGPVGTAISLISFASFGISYFLKRNRKNHLENIFVRILDRDIKNYNLAIQEIIKRTEEIEEEISELSSSLRIIKEFGNDYDKMNEVQQTYLITCVNLMYASTALLTKPIKYLMTRYNEQDLEKYERIKGKQFSEKIEGLILSLANLLYKIELDDTDRKYLTDWLKDDKEFIKSLTIDKDDLELSVVETAEDALSYKYYDTMEA